MSADSTGTVVAPKVSVLRRASIWWCCFAGLACSRFEPDSAIANERPRVAAERDAAARAEPSFLGRADAPVRRSLATERIVEVKKGVGGRSLAFRVVLADGTRAYYKPAQSFAAHWFSEVASYHVDRALGLGRVPPVVSRRVPWATFARAAGNDVRVAEIRRHADGSVSGAMVFWIEQELVPLSPPPGWARWLRIDPPRGPSPFQRLPDWQRGAAVRPGDGAAPDTQDRAAELSDLVLFDYLIGNMDRWGGRFTNVRTLGSAGSLVFMDNANGFHRGAARTRFLDAQLHAVQRFRKNTITAIRGLDLDALRERLAKEPLAPILDAERLAALETRRQHLLEHVAEMQRRHGSAATPW